MAVIFRFSMESGTESSGLSSLISDRIGMSEHFVRKAAHMTEYGILSGTLIAALRKSCGISAVKSALTAVAVSAIYASTDEIHQLFVADRNGSFRDVLIDTSGALIIAVLYLLISKIFIKKLKK